MRERRRAARILAGSLAIGAGNLTAGTPSPDTDPAVVLVWCQQVYDVTAAESTPITPFKGVRAHALVATAMHDALNAVVPVYSPYAFTGSDPAAHPVAAAAQAARDVLTALYPSDQKRWDEELAVWLARVPENAGKRRGVALGGQAAAALLAQRAGDRWAFQGTYEFRQGPGAYQTTPDWNGLVLQPGFRSAEPFGLSSATQFRPPPPPSLDSPRYAAAFNEARRFGRLDSAARTPDQTGYAVWWMEYSETAANRLLKELVSERRMPLWPTARAFALLNLSLYDAYLANWDSKFEYNHWRPYTAVRAAAADGNPATEPDPSWEPLRPTLPFPEYVSAHATACAAAFEMLGQIFGDRTSFTMRSTTAPPGMPARSFTSFSGAAAECADSRVRLGWHFRYATDAGLELGRAVARHLAASHLQPR